MKFKSVALVGKYANTTLDEQMLFLANHLDKLGVSVQIDSSTIDSKEIFAKFPQNTLTQLAKSVDLVIVIGGDGTFLTAARTIINYGVPIIGINQGQLGFMTDIAYAQMPDLIDEIIVKNAYLVEERVLLDGHIIRDNATIYQAIALNDVVLSRGANGNMIEFDISINNEFVLSQKSDGVIFATPTGSTAYSLAAGGPILHPQAHVFSIVPICPQSLSNRPLVVDNNVEITFTLNNHAKIHFDGQECFDLKNGDKIILKKYSKTLTLIHPQNYTYYHTLRTKLEWSKRVS